MKATPQLTTINSGLVLVYTLTHINRNDVMYMMDLTLEKYCKNSGS